MTEHGSSLSFLYADGAEDEITIRRYTGGKPGVPIEPIKELSCPVRTTRFEVPEVTGEVFVYGSFNALSMNPTKFVDDRPTFRQTVTVGMGDATSLVEAFTFGVVDDDRASALGKANYVPALFNRDIEYFGMYMRPGTTYDFRIRADLGRQRLTAWVSGRGDDQWFPLAVDAELVNPVRAINAVRADQFADATGIDNVVISGKAWDEGESVRANQQAKVDRVVADGDGFMRQSMRSLWRQADRHVTVARRPMDSGWWKGYYWPAWWLGFPDIVRTGPKSLVCTHNDGPGHGGGCKIWVRHSDDLGRTWEKAIVIHDHGCNCPRIQKLNDGSLLLTSDLCPVPYHVVFYRSTDRGHTWKQVSRLDPVAAGGNCGCVPSRITETSDGAWIVIGGYYPGHKPFTGDRGAVLEFFRSPDRGKTWKLYSGLEGGSPHSISEPSIVPLPDGRWVLFARENYGGLPGLRSFSNDEGKTWSKCDELSFAISGRTCAGMLSNGRVPSWRYSLFPLLHEVNI